MQTLLVTGGLGFIGSHFIDLALESGYKVINWDKVTYASNTKYRPTNNNYTFKKVEIENVTELPYCDYVVHFAAESHVDRSIENSDPFMVSNIQGTYKLLEALKNKKTSQMRVGEAYKEPVFIYISTDEVFGDIKDRFFFEEDRHKPSNPYAASKSCAEMLVKAWGRTYNIPYRITRTTNNYGERQHEEKLIPKCILQLMEGKKIPIHGTGEYVRNWIYVKDNCEAILDIIQRGKNNLTYHISSDEEFSVLDIVSMIANKFDKNVDDIVEFISNRSGQDVRYALDSSKIKEELGWKQKNKMYNILDRIIESYL